ncbi:MAG: hypothetical protein RL684_1063, partial [Pseudomonadota bacterium]
MSKVDVPVVPGAPKPASGNSLPPEG